jgi:hypothetical protein
MRTKMLGILLASAALFPLTAVADSVQIGPIIATCENQCVVIRDSNGNIISVRDCCGGRVRSVVTVPTDDP